MQLITLRKYFSFNLLQVWRFNSILNLCYVCWSISKIGLQKLLCFDDHINRGLWVWVQKAGESWNQIERKASVHNWVHKKKLILNRWLKMIPVHLWSNLRESLAGRVKSTQNNNLYITSQVYIVTVKTIKGVLFLLHQQGFS